jgi:hypothetical protein
VKGLAAVTDRAESRQADVDVGVVELKRLAAELDGQAYVVTLVTAAGRRPCLSITNRRAVRLTEYIYAAPADDGEPWFWWGWAQRIVPVTDLTGAAAAVGRVLAIMGDRNPISQA